MTGMIRVPVLEARTRWARLRGMLGGEPLPERHALLFDRCRAVHTVGMRRPIDVVFISAEGVVIDLRRGLGAGRVATCRGARSVLELAAGDAWRLGLWRGCRVRLENRGERR